MVETIELDAVLGEFLARFPYVSKKNIRSVSGGFCRLFGLKEIPRNPFEVLPETLGIELHRNAGLPRNVPAQWGYTSTDGRYRIEYSEQRAHESLSIALWHEMGEILLRNPRCPLHGSMTDEIECSLAEQFAIHVLMPEVAVRRIAKEYGHPEVQDKTMTLASHFCVSRQAMIIRLTELGLEYRRADRPVKEW